MRKEHHLKAAIAVATSSRRPKRRRLLGPRHRLKRLDMSCGRQLGVSSSTRAMSTVKSPFVSAPFWPRNLAFFRSRLWPLSRPPLSPLQPIGRRGKEIVKSGKHAIEQARNSKANKAITQSPGQGHNCSKMDNYCSLLATACPLPTPVALGSRDAQRHHPQTATLRLLQSQW